MLVNFYLYGYIWNNHDEKKNSKTNETTQLLFTRVFSSAMTREKIRVQFTWITRQKRSKGKDLKWG